MNAIQKTESKESATFTMQIEFGIQNHIIKSTAGKNTMPQGSDPPETEPGDHNLKTSQVATENC